MAAADDTTCLLNNDSPADPATRNSFYQNADSQRPRMAQLIFVGSIIVMVFITITLSIYRGVKLGSNGFLYFMLGVSLVGFVIIELIMVNFIRKGDLVQEKSWFLYFVGACVFLEAIFTDVLLMQ